MPRLPPLESMRVLEACVRHENFTRAAGELGVTTAAVSLRVRNLEASIGTKLFDRSGPKITPTRTGLLLAAGVAEGLRLMSTAVDACRSHLAPIQVTCVPSFASSWLAPRLAKYHALPDSLPINVDSSIEIRPADQFDVAIRTGSASWPGFDITRLMAVAATPMLSPKLAHGARLSSPRVLASLPLLPHPDWDRWFCEAGYPNSRLRLCAADYPTHELDAAAAVAGAGVALLCPTLFGSLLCEGKLIQPFAYVMQGPAWHFALVKSREPRLTVRRLCSWMEAQASTPTVA